MNFAKYANTYPYPTRADFTSTYYYKEGKLVAINNMAGLDHKIPEIALKDCTKESILNGEMLKSERDKYFTESKNLERQFKVDLADELGLTGHPKFDKLFEIAWDRGHSSGFQEVYNEAQELAELLY